MWSYFLFICLLRLFYSFLLLLRGKAGLANLGNTCFLSSAVQCLSHVQPLTRHILTNAFLRDLNTTNPLGEMLVVTVLTMSWRRATTVHRKGRVVKERLQAVVVLVVMLLVLLLLLLLLLLMLLLLLLPLLLLLVMVMGGYFVGGGVVGVAVVAAGFCRCSACSC